VNVPDAAYDAEPSVSVAPENAEMDGATLATFAVVVISSELMELIGLCHRVVVMRAGTLEATLASDHLTEEELIAHATGTH